MKKLLFSLTALLLSLTVMAQRQYSPNFAIGAKAGTTMSRMSFSPEVKQQFLNGYMIGVTARYTEENHFGLIGEINLQQRGWKEDFEENSDKFNYSRTLTYVQIPLLTHIYFGSRKFKGFFNLGPEFAYLLSSSTKANFDYADIKSVPDFPQGYRTNDQLNMDVENKFDYGISAGAGIEFIVKQKHSFMLEGRFYYGLGNIFHSAKKDVFSASRGMSIEITLGYMIRIR